MARARLTTDPKKNDKDDKRCAFTVSHRCSCKVTDDDFCPGCGFYVCDSCDTHQPWGRGHDVMAHREEF